MNRQETEYSSSAGAGGGRHSIRRALKHLPLAVVRPGAAMRWIAAVVIGGVLGYAVAAGGQPHPDAPGASRDASAARLRPPRADAIRPSSAGTGQRQPSLSFRESLTIAGRPWPLFGPDNAQAGLSAEITYAYPAPVRVVSAGSDGGKRLMITLDFTAPEGTLAEAKGRIQTGTKARVTLVPIPFKWYEFTLRDPATGQEHTWREDTGGPKGAILPGRKVMTWDVPERLDILRRLLAESPRSVAVRVRAGYNFRTVATGVVRTGVVGSISQTIDEVVGPVGEEREASVLLVSRRLLDEVRSRASQQIITYVENMGIEGEEWAESRAEMSRMVSGYFDRLRVASLGDLLNDADVKFLYLYNQTGHAEVRPLLTHNKILQAEHTASYRKKAHDILKTIQDVARANRDARKFYAEVKQRLKGDLESSADVMGFFKGTGNLRLDKDEYNLSKSDLDQIASSREFYASDHDWGQDVSDYAASKVQGELVEERTWAKTIEVARLDRRELEQRAGAIGEFVKTLGFEEVVLQDEVPLEVVTDQGRSYESLEQGLKDTEAKLASTRAEADGLRNRRVADRKRAEAIEARRRELKKRIGDLEAEHARLVDESARLGGSTGGVLDRVVGACAPESVIDLIAGPKFWKGMLETYNHHHQVGWTIADLDGHENWLKGQLAIAVERAKIATERRDEAIAAGRASLQGVQRTIAANAARIDEVLKAIAASKSELDELDAKTLKLLD